MTTAWGRDHSDDGLLAAYARPPQAHVRGAKGAKVLDLCKHHFGIYEAALLGNGSIVIDDRWAGLEGSER